MYDAWVGDGLLLLAIPAYMVSVLLRIRPRLLPGDGILLEDLEKLQGEYEKRYRKRFLLLRVAPALLAVYFGLRMVLFQPDVSTDGPSLASLLIGAFAVYVGSIIGVNVWRIRQEREFVIAHPRFQDSLLPVRPQVSAVLSLMLSLGVIIASIAVHDFLTQMSLLVVGIAGLIIGSKLRNRQISHSRYELP